MPSKTSITVKDRAATPADVVYTPAGEDHNGVHKFRNTDGTLIGDKLISISSRQSNGKTVVRVRLTDPVVVTETINGVARPKVERTAYADLSLTFDDRSGLQERKDIIGKLHNLLAEEQSFAMAAMENLEGIW